MESWWLAPWRKSSASKCMLLALVRLSRFPDDRWVEMGIGRIDTFGYHGYILLSEPFEPNVIGNNHRLGTIKDRISCSFSTCSQVGKRNRAYVDALREVVMPDHILFLFLSPLIRFSGGKISMGRDVLP